MTKKTFNYIFLVFTICVILAIFGVSIKGYNVVDYSIIETIYNNADDLLMTTAKRLFENLSTTTYIINMTVAVYMIFTAMIYIFIPYEVYKLVKGVFNND